MFFGPGRPLSSAAGVVEQDIFSRPEDKRPVSGSVVGHTDEHRLHVQTFGDLLRIGQAHDHIPADAAKRAFSPREACDPGIVVLSCP